MVVGSCLVKLRITQSSNLKEKRRILKSLIDTLKNKFNISVAEIDKTNFYNFSTIGFAHVSNNKTLTDGVINKVIENIESNPNLYIIGCEIEFY